MNFASIKSTIEKAIAWMVYVLSRGRFDRVRFRPHLPEIWYSPWLEDAEFQKARRAIGGRSLLSERKLYDLWMLSGQTAKVPGDVLELGTFRGGSGTLLGLRMRTAGEQGALPKKLVLCDNWGEALPALQSDLNLMGILFSTSDDLRLARTLVSESGIPDSEVIYVRGGFPTILTNGALMGRRFSFVHLDIYDARAFEAGFEALWSLVNPGGVIVFGGYGAISIFELTRAIEKRTSNLNDGFLVQTGSGFAALVKTSGTKV